MKREDRPDETAVEWVYEPCTNATCQGGDSTIRTQLTTIVRNTSNEEVSRSISWLNMFDQEVRSQSWVHSTTSTPKASIIRRTYDSRGLPYEVSSPHLSETTAYYNTTYTYDALGRPLFARRRTSEMDPAVHETAWTYNGLSTTITTPLNHQVIQRRSVVGEIVEVIDASGTTTYAYDAFSNLARVQGSSGSAIVLVYNKLGLKTSMDDPDLGHSTYTYYPFGEIRSQQDANGSRTDYTYDRLSRPLTRFALGGGDIQDFGIEWEWGRGDNDQKDVGQLIRARRGVLTESYLYDDVARLSRRRIVIGDFYDTYDYEYDYNSIGRLATLTYPMSTNGYRLALQYQYEIGLLRQIVDANAPSTVFWRGNEMTASGSTKQQVLGNGVVTEFGIDAITRLTGSIQSGLGGGATLQNESYLYDTRGNLSQRQNYRLGLTEDFHHDGLDRLEAAEVDSGSGGSSTTALEYGLNGNISSRSDVGSGSLWTYHTAKPHAVTLAGPNTYAYDANGNVVSRNGYEIKWTSDNLPWEINGPGKQLFFRYGPSGERFSQDYINGSTIEITEYIGGLLEKVTSDGLTDWRHYIEVGGAPVALMSRKSTGSNTTRYLLKDALQSVAEVLDTAGATYVSESFAPFGARRDALDWDGDCNCADLTKMKDVTRRGYTGHEMIGGVSMDLIHMNGRVYDSSIGRFLSPDPIVQAPYNSQNLNRYSYVLNNPVSYVDPSGFVCSYIQNISDGADPTYQVGACTGGDTILPDYYDYDDVGSTSYGYGTGAGSGAGGAATDLSAGVSPGIGSPMAPIMMAYQVRGFKVMEPSEAQRWANKCVNSGRSGFGQASPTDRAAYGSDLIDKAVQKVYGQASDAGAVSGYYSSTFGKINSMTNVIDLGNDLYKGDSLRASAGAIDTALDFTGGRVVAFVGGALADEYGGAKGLVDSYRQNIEPTVNLGPMGWAQRYTRSIRGDVNLVGCTP